MKRTIELCNTGTDNYSTIAKCPHTPQRKKTGKKNLDNTIIGFNVRYDVGRPKEPGFVLPDLLEILRLGYNYNTELSPCCTVSGLVNDEKVEGALCNRQYSSRLHHIYRQFRTGRNPQSTFPLAVKWSPDGSSFLAKSTGRRLWVFPLPDDEEKINLHTSISSDDSLVANQVIRVRYFPYDFCWHPRMSKSDPGTCVFASCCIEEPLYLWDATTGQMRTSYLADMSRDGDFCRIRPCYSVTMNPEGNRIYAGHKNFVTPFDLHRPGKYTTRHARAIFPKNECSKSGIISAMGCSPNSPGVLAVGSLNGNIAICALNDLRVLQILRGHETGVGQVQFSPDGRYLYSVAPKEEIVCWDVRQSYKVVSKFYRSCGEMGRPRIYFDVDHTGRYLGTGGQDGFVYIYETQTGNRISKFQAASDTVNGFSFHPSQSLAVTCSGYHRFLEKNVKHSLSDDENCLSVWDWSKGSQP